MGNYRRGRPIEDLDWAELNNGGLETFLYNLITLITLIIYTVPA